MLLGGTEPPRTGARAAQATALGLSVVKAQGVEAGLVVVFFSRGWALGAERTESSNKQGNEQTTNSQTNPQEQTNKQRRGLLALDVDPSERMYADGGTFET